MRFLIPHFILVFYSENSKSKFLISKNNFNYSSIVQLSAEDLKCFGRVFFFVNIVRR